MGPGGTPDCPIEYTLSPMQGFFSPGGLLSRRLEGYEPRSSQERMAALVSEALENHHHALVEAGTGTGKTLAYLVPAILHGRRLMVSTGTRALQDQIFYKDIPLLEDILDQPINATYLKGRMNYVCRARLRVSAEEGEAGLFQYPDRNRLERIRAWARTTETGDRAELDFIADDDPLWGDIDARRDRCTGSRCEDFEDCFLTRMRRKAMESDVVIVNHHLFFADLAIRESDMARILPDYSAVIFDEAHELEDIATGYFGFHVSNYRLQELVLDTRTWASAREDARSLGLHPLERATEAFFGPLQTLAEGRHRLPSLNGIDDLIGTLDTLSDTLKGFADPDSPAAQLGRRAGEISFELHVFRNPTADNYVSWLEKRGRGVFLETCPVDVAPLLKEALFDRVPTCILTSATLTVGGTAEYIRSRLGIDDAVTETLETEFHFAEQAALYIPKDLPDYRSPDFTPKAAREISRLLEISKGRAFVLFTSYRQMEACYAELSGNLPYPMLLQGSASRPRLLDAFRGQANAVLFATSSFWQGIDVRGDTLSCVIIDKLPFQVPSDPLVEARIRRMEAQGGRAFPDFQVPAAILRLKQGLGRLIRSRTDRGILAVLDSRLRTRGYGRVFLSSLPDYTVVEDIAGLEHFMSGAEQRASGGAA
jgi:ATP-dependent DNA helicase DinG